MARFSTHAVLALLFVTASAYANVIVSSPGNGETVSSPATFAATANTTTCSRGVAAMGVYIDNELVYTVDSTKLDTTLALTTGKHNAVIQEWDFCGGVTKTAMPITVETRTGVFVTSPANNSTVSGMPNFVATATTGCAKGVSAMGVYVNNQLEYKVNGAKLNTQLVLSPGAQSAVVEEWDNCGGSAVAPISFTVTANAFTNLQASKGWNSWGQEAPNWSDCPAPCPGVSWLMKQGESATSLSGNATQFSISGTEPYADVLWENPLIGQFSTQGLPDTTKTLLPTLHNFTYDAWFFVTDAAVTQAVEFDVNMFMNSVGMTWGTECRVEAGNEWDYWDNVAKKWTPSGVACDPINGGWNHVTIDVEREANNNLLYKSITLNGVTSNLNITSGPFTVPASWYGVTANFQIDGNHAEESNTIYLDKFSFMYW